MHTKKAVVALASLAVPFGRLHRSLYVCVRDLYFLVLCAIWSVISCCVGLDLASIVVRT
jgi:hypothetical protein